MTKRPVHILFTLRTARITPKTMRNIFFHFYISLIFIKMIFQDMVSDRPGTVNDLPLEFEQVLSYRKTHSFSTLIGEDATFKMNKMIEK